MITEADLLQAIAECQGERHPNASTCLKLAAFYTIKNEMYGKDEIIAPSYSYAAPPITYDSGSEFSDEVKGKEWSDVLPVMDELMDTLKVMMPRLYDGVMRKIRGG